MACMLKQVGGSASDFESQPGEVTMKIDQPDQGAVQFDDQRPNWSITDQTGTKVDYQLSNNNQTLSLTVSKPNKYTLVLTYECLPASAEGTLIEDCKGSALSLRLIDINKQAGITIDCTKG